MNNWLTQRIWYQVLLRPSRNPIPCRKQELILRNGKDVVHLFAERSCAALDNRLDPELIILRFLGARGRAELATLDPANRIPNVNTLVWTINPPGFGKSTGSRTITGYANAALFSLDYLTRSFHGAKIWLYGKSIGATLALYVASQRSVHGIVLKNIIDIPELFIGNFPRITKTLVPSALCPQRCAASMKHPALFVISRQDQLAIPATQERIRSLCSGAVAPLIIDGGHDEASIAKDDETNYAVAIDQLWRHTSV